MNIYEVITRLKNTWEIPSQAVHNGQICPFLLRCEFAPAGASDNLLGTTSDRGLKNFWSISESAVLFKDVEYGQWGLEIFTPTQALDETAAALHERPRVFFSSDLVIGRFLGDSELLVLASACSNNGGGVLVSLPIYGREDWPVAAHSFAEFLVRYAESHGDKYWER